MISGFSTFVETDVLIMVGETAAKLNNFSTDMRANFQTAPANVWHNSSSAVGKLSRKVERTR